MSAHSDTAAATADAAAAADPNAAAAAFGSFNPFASPARNSTAAAGTFNPFAAPLPTEGAAPAPAASAFSFAVPPSAAPAASSGAFSFAVPASFSSPSTSATAAAAAPSPFAPTSFSFASPLPASGPSSKAFERALTPAEAARVARGNDVAAALGIGSPAKAAPATPVTPAAVAQGRAKNAAAAAPAASPFVFGEPIAAAAPAASSSAAASTAAAPAFAFSSSSTHTSSASASIAAAAAAAAASAAFARSLGVDATPAAAKGSSAAGADAAQLDSEPGAAVTPAPEGPFPPLPLALDLTRQYAPFPSAAQKILDLLSWACGPTLRSASSDDFAATLQRIKHHFFHREFARVFGSARNLEVYVAQYLPMRCLAYFQLWCSQPILARILAAQAPVTIYCIGAGPGSELVGISMAREAGLREAVRDGKTTLQKIVGGTATAATTATAAPAAAAAAVSAPRFRIHTQDLFDFTPTLHSLLGSLAVHCPLVYPSTHYTFSRGDILDPAASTAPFRNSHVITMMFVLNELLQEHKAGTLAFLGRVVQAMRPGALLVVADSAGDFSQIALGGGVDPEARRGHLQQQQQQQQASATAATDASSASAASAASASESAEVEDGGGRAADATAAAEIEDDDDEEATEGTDAAASASSASTAAGGAPKVRRRYWVYTLLDAIPDLTALVSENSLWYRYNPPGTPAAHKLRYPLKFENMRYFLRIYQKKAATAADTKK